MAHVEAGDRIAQPQVRHRFQTDTHGLARTWAGLRGTGDSVELDVDGVGTPLQLTLASVYAAGQLAARGAAPGARRDPPGPGVAGAGRAGCLPATSPGPPI